MPDKTLVRATEEHWRQGMGRSKTRCPNSLAVADANEDWIWVSTGENGVSVSDLQDGRRYFWLYSTINKRVRLLAEAADRQAERAVEEREIPDFLPFSYVLDKAKADRVSLRQRRSPRELRNPPA